MLECLDCGKEAIHAHHLDLQHGDIRPTDTVLLCASCHRLRHTTVNPNLDRLPARMHSLPIDHHWNFDTHSIEHD